MKTERCSLCGLFGCRHISEKLKLTNEVTDPNLSLLSPAFPLGEQVGDAMQDFSSGKRTSTIPMGPTPEAKDATRVIIPPPPPIARIPGIDIPNKESSSGILSRAGTAVGDALRPFDGSVNKELQKIDMSKDWVNCNICKAKVNVQYLDHHLKVHTHQYEPSNTSTAIVKSSSSISSIGTTSSSVSTSYRREERKGPVLSRIESYRFRQLEQACCASSVSFDGRYSDFTIIFWEKERPGVGTTTHYGGTSSYTTKEWERFSIHIVYDKVEDYFTVSSKLLKRGAYSSSWDSEDTVPDRICYQEELGTEIKRALLFFRISPMSAYRHFRKLFREELVIDYDKSGKALVVQTKNCEALQERLKKNVVSSSSDNRWHGFEGGNYD